MASAQIRIPRSPSPEIVGRIAGSIASSIGKTRRPMLLRLSDVESKPVDWLWEPYLPTGMLALLSGDPGEAEERRSRDSERTRKRE